MAKRKQQRRRRPPVPTSDYADAEGNVLSLRQSLSAATIAKIGEAPAGAAASLDDAWRRRAEMLFERLAVRWEIAGLPITGQAMLLGRYRMADAETQRWVREAIAAHVRAPHPGAVATLSSPTARGTHLRPEGQPRAGSRLVGDDPQHLAGVSRHERGPDAVDLREGVDSIRA